jgi:predicted porin
MNKKLLAIAIGTAMVAAATAATAGDEPTFYAKLHMSIDSVDNGGDKTTGQDGIFVSSNSSRLGIKGAVDLDGGLKAVYKYEMTTDYSSADASTTETVDTPTGTTKAVTKQFNGLSGNRNAYLGLKGGFGQVIAGRHDMPFKTIGRKVDLFGDTIGDNRSVTRLAKDQIKDAVPNAILAGNQTSGDDFADRRDNVVMYSNTFGAVSLAVALGQEENADKGADTGIGIDFKQGPLSVSFAHETHGKGNLKQFALTTAQKTALGVGAAKDSTGMMLTGAYSMGDATVLAGVGQIESLDGLDGADVDVYTLGAKMKSGMNTFKIQYTSAELDGGDASTITALGVDHKLGANTTAYLVYAAVANDDSMGAGFAGTGHAGTVSNVIGEDASGFSLGLVHKF